MTVSELAIKLRTLMEQGKGDIPVILTNDEGYAPSLLDETAVRVGSSYWYGEPDGGGECLQLGPQNE